jgi:hypothetical protein
LRGPRSAFAIRSLQAFVHHVSARSGGNVAERG